MRPYRLLLAVSVFVVPSLFCQENADAQGLLRRLLRERIAPVTPTEPPANQSKRNQGAARIPSIAPAPLKPVSPMVAGRASGVEQAGATEPNGRSNPAPLATPGRFGRSILAPLDFGSDSVTKPQSDSTSASIGIKAINAHPGYPAVQITGFLPHSLADEAGLRVRDYIFAINGAATPTVEKLVEKISMLEAGDTVRLRVGRSGKVRDLDVQLAAKPISGRTRPGSPRRMSSARSKSAADYQSGSPTNDSNDLTPENDRQNNAIADIALKIGAELQDVAGRRGVQVRSVQPGSLAEAAGLKVDDRIVAIDGRMVSGISALTDWLSTNPSGSTAEIRLIRSNELVDVTLSFAGDAKQSIKPANQSDSAATAKEEKSSILGGLGSVFGGMFNKAPASGEPGKPAIASEPATPEAKTPEPDSKKPSSLSLPPIGDLFNLPSTKSATTSEPKTDEKKQ